MKIHEYYRDTANININGSIAALVPTIIIVVGNLSFFQNKQIMLLTIPFLLYSFISFQIYLYRMNQSILIERNMAATKSHYHSLFKTRHLLVVFMNTQSKRVLLYYPNGHQAGMIRKYHGKKMRMFKQPKIYALYNQLDQVIGFYKITRRTSLKIEVYDQDREYLGCFEKEKLAWLKNKKGLKDSTDRYIGAVKGAGYYMDEQVINQSKQQDVRLRRGWMPLEWSKLFPESNTPLLSFSKALSDNDKLVRMSFLINEYFIER